MKQKQIVTIEKIIPGGSGLARLANGLVVMVPKVLTGEKVMASIIQQKKSHAKATLVEVLESSALRVSAPCPIFSECGGCDFQQLIYPEQSKLKQELLKEQLTKNLQVDLVWDRFNEASNPFAYRQRIKLQVDTAGRVGFFQKNSHEIVRVSICLLAEPLINEVLDYLLLSRDMFALLKHSQTIELMYSPNDNRVILLVHFLRKPRPQDKIYAQAVVSQNLNIKSLSLLPKDMAMVGPFLGSLPNSKESAAEAVFINFSVELQDGRIVQMSLEAGGFCQVNRKQNEVLIQTMLAWAGIQKGDKLLDLYCGMGNFSIPAAFLGAQVFGMDIQRSAIRSAKRNALVNGLVNCHFVVQDAVVAAKQLAEAGDSFDLLLLDPPRHGCRAVIPYLVQIASEKIIYISCDPATLCRDLKDILEAGFQIEKIQGLDMFPQTHHVETIVLLKRAD